MKLDRDMTEGEQSEDERNKQVMLDFTDIMMMMNF